MSGVKNIENKDYMSLFFYMTGFIRQRYPEQQGISPSGQEIILKTH